MLLRGPCTMSGRDAGVTVTCLARRDATRRLGVRLICWARSRTVRGSDNGSADTNDRKTPAFRASLFYCDMYRRAACAGERLARHSAIVTVLRYADLEAATRRLSARETVATVDRSVAARLERYFGFLTAFAAGCWVHLARTAVPATTAAASASATTAALSLSGGATRGTALRLRVALRREELLIVGGERKLLSAILAR
jgi:uncharacterized protein YceH (UPF0502 family)